MTFFQNLNATAFVNSSIVYCAFMWESKRAEEKLLKCLKFQISERCQIGILFFPFTKVQEKKKGGGEGGRMGKKGRIYTVYLRNENKHSN